MVKNIELENQISSFYKKLDEVKTSSIKKLSDERQKNIYLELKREKEEEERKREEAEREKRNK